MGNVAKYQHGWNMTFTVVELLMIIPKSTYLSISLPYFSIYHFFSLTLYYDYSTFNPKTPDETEISQKAQRHLRLDGRNGLARSLSFLLGKPA